LIQGFLKRPLGVQLGLLFS